MPQTIPDDSPEPIVKSYAAWGPEPTAERCRMLREHGAVFPDDSRQSSLGWRRCIDGRALKFQPEDG